MLLLTEGNPAEKELLQLFSQRFVPGNPVNLDELQK